MSMEDLIAGLNEGLAAELGTIIRYNDHASKCSGTGGMGLRSMYTDEMAEEGGHARYLADTVVDLGGQPTTTPQSFDSVTGNKAMLEQDLEFEQSAIALYVKYAAVADELGLIDVKLKLEEMAADEAGHARLIERILRGM